jgi:hypothetical protein
MLNNRRMQRRSRRNFVVKTTAGLRPADSSCRCASSSRSITFRTVVRRHVRPSGYEGRLPIPSRSIARLDPIPRPGLRGGPVSPAEHRGMGGGAVRGMPSVGDALREARRELRGVLDGRPDREGSPVVGFLGQSPGVPIGDSGFQIRAAQAPASLRFIQIWNREYVYLNRSCAGGQAASRLAATADPGLPALRRRSAPVAGGLPMMVIGHPGRGVDPGRSRDRPARRLDRDAVADGPIEPRKAEPGPL